MATQGFELCQEDHVRNTFQWSGRRGGDESERSVSSRDRRAALRANYLNDDMTSVASYFTDDSRSSKSVDDGGATRRRRKCLVWMMACYMLAAAVAFFSVLIWKNFAEQKEEYHKSNMESNQRMDGSNSERACNGLVSNCYRRVNEIMFAGVHNAMSSRENNFLAYNNLFTMEDALMAGFRALTIDSCDCSRVGIQLCHGLCVAGFRRPVPAFAAIVDFLNKNPYEVVILELQIGDNSLLPLFDLLQEVEGLESLMYGHPFILDPFPTLGELIDMNKRLLIFQHDGANCMQGECPPNLHDTYAYMYETPHDSEGVEELLDGNRTCVIARGWEKAPFVMMNHFASDSRGLPDYDVAVEANTVSNIEQKLEDCQERLNRTLINLVVVDFWNVGDVLQVVFDFNNNLQPITYAPSESPTITPTVSPRPSPDTVTSASVVSAMRTTAPARLDIVGELFAPTTMPSQEPTISLASEQGTSPPTDFPFSDLLEELISATSAHSASHLDYLTYAPTAEESSEGTMEDTFEATFDATSAETLDVTYSRGRVEVDDKSVGHRQ